MHKHSTQTVFNSGTTAFLATQLHHQTSIYPKNLISTPKDYLLLGNNCTKSHLLSKCYKYVKGQLLHLYNGVTAEEKAHWQAKINPGEGQRGLERKLKVLPKAQRKAWASKNNL